MSISRRWYHAVHTSDEYFFVHTTWFVHRPSTFFNIVGDTNKKIHRGLNESKCKGRVLLILLARPHFTCTNELKQKCLWTDYIQLDNYQATNIQKSSDKTGVKHTVSLIALTSKLFIIQQQSRITQVRFEQITFLMMSNDCSLSWILFNCFGTLWKITIFQAGWTQ